MNSLFTIFLNHGDNLFYNSSVGRSMVVLLHYQEIMRYGCINMHVGINCYFATRENYESLEYDLYHWPICWMICFIQFVRLSFPYWL